MGFAANGTGKPLKFLIYGRTGWIGGLLGKLCEAQGIDYQYGSGRLENQSSLGCDIDDVNQPCLQCRRRHRPAKCRLVRVHKVETIRTNVSEP
ncbi:hypothetical protein Nepgr_031652 [Nepenthes gracilis]|uniref:RmlD-like substrate binding domain-containing protein n=1 Tax=Nepenthes gracilis TaxID=150966 RepID=A0AAD3TIP3_NEPGR|nr:hypothetical protein Nepgr_031652 [Nepenthes gracilis]